MKPPWMRSWTKHLFHSALGLTLGLTAHHAVADEIQWRPGPKNQPVPAFLDRPALLPPSKTQGGSTGGPTDKPLVSLERPVALTTTPGGQSSVGSSFRPVAYSTSGDNSRPLVFRAQMSNVPKALPVGPVMTSFDPPVPRKELEPIPPPSDVTGPPKPPAPGAIAPVPGMVVPYPGGFIGPYVGVPAPGVPIISGDPGCGPGGPPVCLGPGPDACCPEGSGRWGRKSWHLFGWDKWDGCAEGAQDCFWINGEYLLWFIGGNRPPALVTGGPTINSSGQMVGPPMTMLFGGYTNPGAYSGGRMGIGYWFTEDHCIGIDGSFFALGGRSVLFRFDSGPGGGGLFRPFYDADNGNTQAYQIVSNPPDVVGGVNVSVLSRLWGADVNLRTNWVECDWFRLDFLWGFRYLGLDDNLEVKENLFVSQQTPGTRFGPGNYVVTDQFQTRNRFYGGQVGLDSEFHWGNWFISARTKVAIGNVHQTAYINGETLVNGLPLPGGGLLALTTNSGRHSRNQFAVLPEVGLNLGYQCTDCLRFYVGYNFLLLSNAVRAGDQIDPYVSSSRLPGQTPKPGSPLRPAFDFKGNDFWVHGVNFGLEFRY